MTRASLYHPDGIVDTREPEPSGAPIITSMEAAGLQAQRVTEIAFEAFGVRLGLRVDDRALMPAASATLPPGWLACEDRDLASRFSLTSIDGIHYEVARDATPLGPPAELEVALGMLDSHIRLEVAQRASGWLFIHAGAVAVGNRALVLPGASFSGKTTLVEALISQGATYFSDEYAVLDDDGLLHPYPKPLSIRAPGAKRTPVPAPTAETHAAAFGAEIGDRAVPIKLIVSMTYVPGARWDPRTLSPAGGALALLSHSVTVRDAPERVLALAGRVAQGARALEGDRGEAGETAGLLLELLGA